MAAIEPLWCQHPLFPWTQLQFRLLTDMYSMYVHSIDSEFILNRFRGLIMIGLVLWYATVTVGCNHNTHPALHSTCKALTLHSGAVTSSTLCKWTRSIKTVCSPVYIQLSYVCIYWPEGWVYILPCKLLMPPFPTPPPTFRMESVTGHSPQTKGVTVLHSATTCVLHLRLLSLCHLVKVGAVLVVCHACMCILHAIVHLFRQLDLHADTEVWNRHIHCYTVEMAHVHSTSMNLQKRIYIYITCTYLYTLLVTAFWLWALATHMEACPKPWPTELWPLQMCLTMTTMPLPWHMLSRSRWLARVCWSSVSLTSSQMEQPMESFGGYNMTTGRIW